ncbi:hypothetical protein TPA0910_09650 [Streptomyces hygroscopicus subsp. sporocinereus]|uniref:Uncharacterized protein n=1 Tax=Streptomyces hygroscopicus TaxID=1912 RepID=A0ABQ3TT85_STRHY|nr:hypothetical protein TPA0910_09650 [Streptomyces hygroscopicus]
MPLVEPGMKMVFPEMFMTFFLKGACRGGGAEVRRGGVLRTSGTLTAKQRCAAGGAGGLSHHGPSRHG